MKKLRSFWGPLKKRLQNIALGITGINFRIMDIPRSEGEIGYTSKGKVIHLSNDNEFLDTMDEAEKVMFVEGVFAHELMHQLSTDFPTFERAVNGKASNEQQIFQMLFNIMEDPAIEWQAPAYFGGHLLNALHYSIKAIYKQSPELNPTQRPMTQFVNAFIHYGDGGIIKGKIADKKAKEYFYKAIPYFDKCIEEPDGRKRVQIAEEVFELTKPLWEEEAKAMNELKKLLQELADMTKEAGKGESQSNSSDGACGEPDGTFGDGASKKTAKRRKATQKESGKENSDETSSDKASSNDDTKGEKTDESASSSPKTELKKKDNTSEATDGSSDGSKDGKDPGDKADPSSSAGEKGESKGSADGSDEHPDGAATLNGSGSDASASSGSPSGSENLSSSEEDEKKRSSDSSDSLTAEEDIMHSKNGADIKIDYSEDSDGIDEGNDTDDDEVIDEEEYELSETDIEAIKHEVDACINESEEGKVSSEEASEEVFDIPEMSVDYPGKSCINLSIPDASRLANEYDLVREHLSAGINNLTHQLKRIFQNDQEDREYRQSGRVSVKRMTGSSMTSRMFSRRVSPENKSDIALMLVIDVSGSMYGKKELIAKQTAIGLAEVFHNLNIPMKVMTFSADGSVKGHGYDAIHTHYINWHNNIGERYKLLNIAAGGNNFDGYSIRYAGKVIKKRREQHKLMIVVSDGQPACRSYHGKDGIVDTKNAIKEASKHATVLGVAIDANKDVLYNMYGLHFVDVENIDQLFEKLGNVIKKEIRSW